MKAIQDELEPVRGEGARILSVIGTRPEAIKMAPVVSALERRGGCAHRLALTGQHTDMVEQVLGVFGLDADYDLKIMKPGQSLYDVGHACMDGLREVAEDFRPDVTIVQGDTATVRTQPTIGPLLRATLRPSRPCGPAGSRIPASPQAVRRRG